ncbi:50S ribosomal protein L25/general stress protein Ctc [Desulfovibrio litoralis]|uniref:Large ribosomal subunit protein bL25 n=1 Tax=Desulfovibrio litoralis DSM 11393 TaxID=1121455 RepID=A0A1M7S9S7_9BACT|nr:50S ribosomal protein L25/general stress protein Ctc [Desulfovibrio litoralis]SHN55134.1 LSU ribosomal protein L25P [Desulfovibrio litoralis DSM 11393]
MSNLKVLSVTKRNETGKGANRRLRSEGLVTGIYYNAKGETIPVQVPHLAMEKMAMFAGRTTVINLEIDDNGKKTTHPVLIWELERHPFKNRFDHVDFYGVDFERPIEVKVPLEFIGVAKGTKLGGSLEVLREELQIIAKPLSMPKIISIDINDLGLNQHVRVGDLKLEEGVKAKLAKEAIIVSVISKVAAADEEGGEKEKKK